MAPEQPNTISPCGSSCLSLDGLNCLGFAVLIALAKTSYNGRWRGLTQVDFENRRRTT
jgi:hypothetical protein